MKAAIVLVVAFLLIQVGGTGAAGLLAYDREALAGGQLWRLLTAHAAHLGWVHAVMNGLGLVMVIGIARPAWGAGGWALRLLWLSLGVSLGLWWGWPELSRYVGFSGVLHGLFLWALWPMMRAGDRFAWLCAALLAVKLAAEAVWGALQWDASMIGGAVITQAHALGVVSAIIGIAVRQWLDEPPPGRR